MLPEKIELAGVPCSLCDSQELADWITAHLANREEGISITCVNAHIHNLAHQNPALLQQLNQSDIVGADGMSVVWGIRRTTAHVISGRCNMTDTLHALLDMEMTRPITALVIGCSPQEAALASREISHRNQMITVKAFREGYASNSEILEWIQQHLPADMVLIGMGTPRSEGIVLQAARLPGAGLAWHVGGGSLLFLAGVDQEAPDWMKTSGLQWLHRLLRQPRKMAKRYLMGNLIFTLRICSKKHHHASSEKA